MNLDIGSAHFKLTLASLGWVAAAIFLFFFFRTSEGVSALDTALSGANRVLDVRPAFLKHMAALQDSTRRATQRARALVADTTRLRHDRDSLLTLATSIIGAARTAPQMQDAARVLAQANQACVDLQTNCEKRAALWENVARQQGTRADLATGRANLSDSTLKSIGGAAECHLLHVGPVKLFGCPSRLTAFKVGIPVGIGIVEGLRLLLTGKF
jgi:hypothetical protein